MPHLIDLLDSRFKRLVGRADDAFLLELREFLKFLRSHGQLKTHVEGLVAELVERAEAYRSTVASQTARAVEIKDRLIGAIPELDDRSMERPEGPRNTWEFEHSFAEFENIAGGNRTRFGYPLERPGRYEDTSDLAALIRILRVKVDRYNQDGEDSGRRVPHEIEFDLQDLESAHKHVYREWVDYQRVSAARALWELETITEQINPEPEDLTEWRSLDPQAKFQRAIEQMFTRPDYSWVRAAVYGAGEIATSRRGRADVDELVAQVREEATRVYDAVRERLLTSPPPTLPSPATGALEPAGGQADFSFVADPRIRAIVERDYGEFRRLDPAATPKAVLIEAGGLIEALLFDALVASGKWSEEKASKFYLNDMIGAAHGAGIIGEEKLSQALRRYRNLIHVGRELANPIAFEASDARLAAAAVEVLAREVRAWHAKREAADHP